MASVRTRPGWCVDTEELPGLGLERRDLLSENEMPGMQDPLKCRGQFAVERGILAGSDQAEEHPWLKLPRRFEFPVGFAPFGQLGRQWRLLVEVKAAERARRMSLVPQAAFRADQDVPIGPRRGCRVG